MHSTSIVVCLPIADRQVSYTFYRDGLGLEPVGEPAEDGVPEPLQFTLNDGLRVMLVPTGGFDLITGDHDTAPSGYSECVLTVATNTDDGVQELIHRARAAGARIVTTIGQQPWGYAGAFADPDGHIWMVRSEGQTA
jgi:predicted lactoylglutathione lyase